MAVRGEGRGAAEADLEEAHICPQGGHQGVGGVEHQRHGCGGVGRAGLHVPPPPTHGPSPRRAELASHHCDVGSRLSVSEPTSSNQPWIVQGADAQFSHPVSQYSAMGLPAVEKTIICDRLEL